MPFCFCTTRNIAEVGEGKIRHIISAFDLSEVWILDCSNIRIPMCYMFFGCFGLVVRPRRGRGENEPFSFYIYLTSPRSCFKAFTPYTLNFSETMF